jgi:hypothetical protein
MSFSQVGFSGTSPIRNRDGDTVESAAYRAEEARLRTQVVPSYTVKDVTLSSFRYSEGFNPLFWSNMMVRVSIPPSRNKRDGLFQYGDTRVNRKEDNRRKALIYQAFNDSKGVSNLYPTIRRRDIYPDAEFSYLEDLISGKQYVDWKAPVEYDLTTYVPAFDFINEATHIDWAQWVDSTGVERFFKIDYHPINMFTVAKVHDLEHLFNDIFGGLGARPIVGGRFTYRPFRSVRAILISRDRRTMYTQENLAGVVDIVGGSTINGANTRVQSVFETLIREVVEEIFGEYTNYKDTLARFKAFFSEIEGFYIYDHHIVFIITVDVGVVDMELIRLGRNGVIAGDPEVTRIGKFNIRPGSTVFTQRLFNSNLMTQQAADTMNTFYLLDLLH